MAKQKKITLDDVTEEEIKNSGFNIALDVWEKNENYRNKRSSTKEDFINNFFRGYRGRPSVKKGNKCSTVPDPLIETIIGSKIKNITAEEVKEYTTAHRAEMSAENVIGSILEEYIHTKLLDIGWTCLWGSTFKAADFTNKKGELLQVKNKDNTENSSSDKIREGTEIKKWNRMKAKTGETCWSELNTLINKPNCLSEKDFDKFTKKLIDDNPDLINLD